MITFTSKPQEGGSCIICGSFYDTGNCTADPKKVKPKTALWDLRDRHGTTINSRENVPIALAEDYTIVLSGDDLLIAVETEAEIYLTIHGTYDSDEGADLSMVQQGKIIIDEVVGIGVK